MMEFFENSLFFGAAVSLVAYEIGLLIFIIFQKIWM